MSEKRADVGGFAANRPTSTRFSDDAAAENVAADAGGQAPRAGQTRAGQAAE